MCCVKQQQFKLHKQQTLRGEKERKVTLCRMVSESTPDQYDTLLAQNKEEEILDVDFLQMSSGA